MTGQARSVGELLTFDAVTCARGGRTVFEALSFALEAGGAVLVTGPNGAGKSSLIRLAAGLLAPASGTVRAGAVGIGAARALLGEAAALDPELTLARALGFWARLDGASDAAVGDALGALGLGELAPVPVRLLSTGQRRRAACARVVASGAAVWLLDEPANGLDQAAVATLEGLIARHRMAGGAVVVATHLPVALPGAQVVTLPVLPGEGRGSASGRVATGPRPSPGRA